MSQQALSLTEFLQSPSDWLGRVTSGEILELQVEISSQQRVAILSRKSDHDVAQLLAAETRVSGELARLLQEFVQISAAQLLAIAREEQLGSNR